MRKARGDKEEPNQEERKKEEEEKEEEEEIEVGKKGLVKISE